MKRGIRQVLVVAALIAGAIGIGLNGSTVCAGGNTTGTYNEEKQRWVTDNGYWEYQYCEDDKEVMILRYIGSEAQPRIPDSIDGKPVTKITGEVGFGEGERDAFFGNTIITAVELPHTLVDIGSNAFYGCTNLTSITIDNHDYFPDTEPEEGVEYRIGAGAFYGCTSLETLNLPQGITNIDEKAFYGCSALTCITIPDTVTTINNMAFSGCSVLGNITLPDSIETLGANAFEGCEKLRSVNLSSKLTEINDSTFKGCYALESIVIPEGVTTIGQDVFFECKALKIVVIPSSVTQLGGLTPHSLFLRTGNLEEPTIYVEKDSAAMAYANDINNHVKSVLVRRANTAVLETQDGWQYMQQDNEIEIVGYTGYTNAMKETEIPDSIIINPGNTVIPVTSMASRVFADMSSIERLTFPDSIRSIGNDICKGCTALSNITLSNHLTSIGDNAFTGCTSLTKIVIPSKVTYIGNYAFDGCEKLTNVSFAKRETGATEKFEIGYYAFRNCDLQNFDVPSGVKDILEYTFYGNKNMTRVTLPEGIEHISGHAFHGCSKLTGVTLPGTLTYIWEYAFAGCESIEEIVIPDNVTNIEQRAFVGCTALNKATILSNVKMIGTRAFGDCEALTIYTNAGSATEAYAIKDDIPYVIIGGTQQPPSNNNNNPTDTDTPADTDTPTGTDTPAGTDTPKEPAKDTSVEEVKIPSVSKVNNFKASAKKKALGLRWKKVKGASGYQIQVSTKKNFKGAKTTGIKKTKVSYTASKLKAKTKYYVRIRAYVTYKDASGKTQRAYGKWTVLSKKTK